MATWFTQISPRMRRQSRASRSNGLFVSNSDSSPAKKKINADSSAEVLHQIGGSQSEMVCLRGSQVYATFGMTKIKKRKRVCMNMSRISKGLLLAASLLIATSALAANKGSLNISEPVTVNRTKLAPGD
jgi:hypothetical protein